MDTDQNDLDTLAARIRRARESRGMQQKELAERLQVPPSTIYKYEKKGVRPNGERMGQIAVALGVTATWLATGIGDPAPDIDEVDIAEPFDAATAVMSRMWRMLAADGMISALRAHTMTGPDMDGLVHVKLTFDGRRMRKLVSSD